MVTEVAVEKLACLSLFSRREKTSLLGIYDQHMITFDIPIKEVTAEVLQSLVDNKVKEDLQLEYKETLPSSGGRDKFLRSISAFANSSGGDLIYGVKAKRDDDGTPTGEAEEIVGLSGVNLDQEKLRLEQWIRTCIEPTPPFRIEVIERGNQPPCLLVRVPNSWETLHIIKTLENPFYGRNSGGKYPLSLSEIRAGFLQGETARGRVRRFREERVNRIVSGETPTNVGSGPKIIFHALPLKSDNDAWGRFRSAEGNGLQRQGQAPLWLQVPLIYKHAQRPRYNADGFVVETLEEKNNYTQVFRDCGFESVEVTLIQLSPLSSRDDKRRIFYGINIERGVIKALTSYQRLWTSLGVAGPMVLFLSLTGVEGSGIAVRDHWHSDFIAIDRDCVMTQDVMLENLSDRADRILKPLFDFMWNAGGYSESPFYDENLSWVGDKQK